MVDEPEPPADEEDEGVKRPARQTAEYPGLDSARWYAKRAALGPASFRPDDTVDLEDAEDDPADGQEELSSLVGEIPWTDDHGGPIKIVFAGGKGGAGRSLLLANIGLFLSRLGREVVLADLDPTGSNLHTYLGMEPFLPSANTLMRRPGPPRIDRLQGMNLRLVRSPVPMGFGPLDPARVEVLDAALDLSADVLLLDMGSQADELTLDMFLSADAAVMVVLPEPVALERAYAFLRLALFRRLLAVSEEDDSPAELARAFLLADDSGQLDSPLDLISAMGGASANVAEALRARLLSFSPHLLVNRCRTRADRAIESGMASALRLRWGVRAELLGGVDYDDAAWEATRRRRPLVLEYPGSSLGRDVERIARRLLALAGAREARP